MGWGLKWVSSSACDFNADYGVTFSPDDLASGDYSYNYNPGGFSGPEAPGLSTFIKEDGQIYHSYSTYGRGLDHFNGAYQLLDLTAKGDAAALAKAVGGTVLPNGSVRVADAGQVSAMPGFAEGDWWVQDAAAALPVQILKPQSQIALFAPVPCWRV